ncbi:MAG: hypothetical protein QOE92_1688 [Chloroflexota bacterium]|jgi:hypothetical protein|nr:hypothetical protein [Chloroflexota bacterium]
MSRERSILNIRYTPVSKSAGRSASRLTGYIQKRDNEREDGEPRDPEEFMHYAAYRDRAQPEGRMFNENGTAGERERLDLVKNIRETIEGARHGDRAFYQMVISPENAGGVDLRELTRKTMQQLQKDCGRTPWIAAEHRNTRHPHVHVVMPARREFEPGRCRTVIISRQRLGRAKEAMGSELDRQRDRSLQRGLEKGPKLELAVKQRQRGYERDRGFSPDRSDGRGLAAAMSVPKERTRSGGDTSKALRGMAKALSRMFEVGEKVQRDIEQARESERSRGWGRDR